MSILYDYMIDCDSNNYYDIDWCSSRLGVEESSRPEDDQQSGEHLASGSSSGVHDQVYDVTGL